MKNFDALKKCVEVIGEVRIREESVVASGFQHACPDRRSFSLVGFKVNGPQKRGCRALDDLSGIVRAPVVDKNDFICLKVLLTKSAESREAGCNPFLFVVTGNDDGYEIRHFRHEPRNRANLCHESTKVWKLEERWDSHRPTQKHGTRDSRSLNIARGKVSK
jgi:hypothetical protein